jgi:2-dehydro-3-deoxygluconokinase
MGKSLQIHQMKSDFIAFGELLLRLTPPDHFRFSQANSFNIIYGGSEANVAAALAAWGVPAKLVTGLPSNPIGDAAVQHLKKTDIGVDHVFRTAERLGVYFVEEGASVRSTQVVYDRKNSSFAKATAEHFDWELILKKANWFHTTGITAGLGASLAIETGKALRLAKEKGLTTSFDLNYRAQLWTRDVAKGVLDKILPYVDIFIGLDSNMQELLGISYKGEAKDPPSFYLQEIQQRYGCKLVATSLRESISPTAIRWKGIAYNGTTYFTSADYDLSLVDRIGTGDAFTAGLIYALMQSEAPQKALEFAVAAGAWKHSIVGDHTIASLLEISSLLEGGRGGSILR